MDCRQRASWRGMIYTQIILFLSLQEYSIFYCTSQIHLDCREKVSLKDVTWTKSHFCKRGLFISPPKHTEALHLSPEPPPSWILLYANSMYLKRLEGSTASAGDSKMLHFSLLTKERPRLAPPDLDLQNRCFYNTEGCFFFQPPTTQPLYLLLTFTFQKSHNEKKTTAIRQKLEHSSNRGCRNVIVLADHKRNGSGTN